MGRVQKPLWRTFYGYFSKSFNGEYHMDQFLLLQWKYMCETPLKANVATDEGKEWDETWTLNKEMKLE